MRKILIIFVVTAAIGLSSWQIVQSQDVAGPMDESQIIVGSVRMERHTRNFTCNT